MKWLRQSRRKIPTRVVIRAVPKPGDQIGGHRFNVYLRRDTWEKWQEFDPVLLRNEVGVVLSDDLGGVAGFKVGDGSTAWSGLRYFW